MHNSNNHDHDLEAAMPDSPYMNGHDDDDDDDSASKKKVNNTFKVPAEVVSDAVLGLSDGLTVPFALTAGLSAFGSPKLVVLGGLAELIAGAISMGLGGWVAARSERDSYRATCLEASTLSESSKRQIMTDVLSPCRLPPETMDLILHNLDSNSGSSDQNHQISQNSNSSSSSPLHAFIMRFHYQSPVPPPNRPLISALTLALAYFIGGFIPLIPYFFARDVLTGLYWSIGTMAVVLLAFGYVKACVVSGWGGRENVRNGWHSAVQMLVVGAVAAGAAVGLVRLVT